MVQTRTFTGRGWRCRRRSSGEDSTMKLWAISDLHLAHRSQPGGAARPARPPRGLADRGRRCVRNAAAVRRGDEFLAVASRACCGRRATTSSGSPTARAGRAAARRNTLPCGFGAPRRGHHARGPLPRWPGGRCGAAVHQLRLQFPPGRDRARGGAGLAAEMRCVSADERLISPPFARMTNGAPNCAPRPSAAGARGAAGWHGAGQPLPLRSDLVRIPRIPASRPVRHGAHRGLASPFPRRGGGERASARAPHGLADNTASRRCRWAMPGSGTRRAAGRLPARRDAGRLSGAAAGLPSRTTSPASGGNRSA